MPCRAKASSVSQVGLDAAPASVLFFVTGGVSFCSGVDSARGSRQRTEGYTAITRLHAFRPYLGIEATGASSIMGNTVIGNLDGIVAASGSIVSNNTVQANRAVGIAVPSRGVEGPGGLMSGNTVVGNGKEGILGGPGSLVSGNMVLNNGAVGIDVGADLFVSGSTVSGNTVQGNGGTGISVGGGSSVSNNTVGEGITGLCPSNITQNTSVNGFSFSGKGCDFHDNVGDVTVLE